MWKGDRDSAHTKWTQERVKEEIEEEGAGERRSNGEHTSMKRDQLGRAYWEESKPNQMYCTREARINKPNTRLENGMKIQIRCAI